MLPKIARDREVTRVIGASVLLMALNCACNGSDNTESYASQSDGANSGSGARSSAAKGGVGGGGSGGFRGGTMAFTMPSSGGVVQSVTTIVQTGGRESFELSAGASGYTVAVTNSLAVSGASNGGGASSRGAGSAGRLQGSAGTSQVTTNAGASGKRHHEAMAGSASLGRCPPTAVDNQACNDHEEGYECEKGTGVGIRTRDAKTCQCEKTTTNSGATRKRWSCD